MIWTICCIAHVAAGQHWPMKRYTPREGMGHSIVYRTTQTRDGLLWFSTDNGLTCYDGTSFSNFTAKDGLGSNFVFGLAETDTALLVSSYGAGISRYVRHRGIALVPFNNNILYPIDIIQNRAGLWVIDRHHKLYRLQAHDFHQWNKDLPGYDMKYLAVFNLMETSWGGIFGAFSSGITRYIAATDAFEMIRIKGLPGKMNCQALLALEKDVLVAAMDRGVYRVNLADSTASLLMEGKFDNHPQSLFKDHAGNLWIANLQGELWFVTADFSRRERVLEETIINNIFQDSDHNIWLATYGQGALCIPSRHVKQYTVPVGILVTDLLFDKANQRPVIVSLNHRAKALSNDRIEDINSRQLPAVLKTGRKISAAAWLPSGEYIIGSYSYVYKGHGKKIDSLKCDASVASVYKSTSGEYWCGHRMGLSRIDSTFTKRESIQALQKRIVRSLSQDNDGNILAATDQGVYIGNNETWQVIDEAAGLPNNYVNVIVRDSLSRCHWIGTNEGLCRLGEDRRITRYDHSLARLRCNAIVGDRQGNIWIATNRGLVKMSHGRFHLFNEQDGLPSDIFKLAYDHTHGRLYALSWNTLAVIDTEPFMTWQSGRAPVIVLKNVAYNGHPLSTIDDYLELPEPARYLSLSYVVPYHKSREGWQVHYRVNNNPWHAAQMPGEANLYDLPSGNLQIQIKVTDGNQHTLAIRTQRLYNPTPLYRKAWFAVLCAALGTFIVVALTKVVIQRQSNRKQLELLETQQRMDLEHKALQNMLNPHFMNNAINSIQAFVTRNDQRQTLSYLAKFARLMRANLELLESSSVSVDKELKNLELYLSFETLRFSGNLTYSIEVSEDVNARMLKLPSLVLQPFVENAIWHGILPKQEMGHVSIRVLKTAGHLVVLIEDDGIGVSESKRRQADQPKDKPSRGMLIIQNRFALLNNVRPGHAFTLEDKSLTDPAQTGTRVEITLPITY